MKSNIPKLTHVIHSNGRGVGAVTSLGDDVIVARNKQIEVYNSMTFTLQRCLTVPGLGPRLMGLIGCLYNNSLCVSDYDHGSVHRVDLSRNTVKKWSVASQPTGLSMNKAHNLVVACYGANKLQEYTMDGILVREISLQAGVTSPWHAIQLSTGDYVVSQCASPGVVSVVRVDGQVVHSYGQSQTSDVGQMTNPTSLAVTSNDDILVADELNDRILSINRSPNRAEEMALSVDGGIRYPIGLCLDESSGRLYIGEWCGQHRVLVFDSAKV